MFKIKIPLKDGTYLNPSEGILEVKKNKKL